MAHLQPQMTIQEASQISGLTPWTIRFLARTSQFAATKPSNKEGWDISEQSFRGWMKRRRMKGANLAMKDQLKGVAA